MFKHILVAVDGSESNKIAVDTAVALAKETGATLTALSVFDPGGYGNVAAVKEVADEVDYMKQICDNILEYVTAKATEAGISFETKTVAGNPAVKIVEATADYDLLVTGTLGRTGFSRIVMGSVAEKVVRLANCPVLVCRSKA
ncbi:MAG: universal stress protein [Candidatus Methanomethylophilus sp.]|nr:universal stress protein [Methanomethylophilus sp.]